MKNCFGGAGGAKNGVGTLIPMLILETAGISPQVSWHYQVEGFFWNILFMFLINKLWDPIHALAFQTCFLYPLTSWACPLTFQTCFPCLSGMLRYACLSGLGISQDLKKDLTTLLSDWSTSLISGYKLGVVRIGISVATDSKEETVAACGLWGSAMGKTPSTWLPRNIMGKYWSTSDITSKSQGKIAGIRQKRVWHWI